MTTPQQVLDIARGELGTRESPAGSNRTKYGRWYGLDGNPWCAMFVSWCFAAAELPQAFSTPKGFAYTPVGAVGYQRAGRWSTRNPQPGDVVFFRFSGPRIHHVGIVESVRPDGSIVTLEGNTSAGAAGSQDNGGGVYRRARRSGIVGYGRPLYTQQEDDGMAAVSSEQIDRLIKAVEDNTAHRQRVHDSIVERLGVSEKEAKAGKTIADLLAGIAS